MTTPMKKIKKTLQTIMVSKPEYSALKQHLNKQPVGYPRTLSGVENRLLTEIFTPLDAETALYLTSHFETLETIYGRAKKDNLSMDELEDRLNGMEERGSIFLRFRDEIAQYALHPFVVGMFEMQLGRLTPGYYMDTLKYGIQGFGMEYLSTQLPQMRTIPIRKSIQVDNNIATYDEIRSLVENATNDLQLVACICKTGKDLLNEPCQKTKRRNVCLLFSDLADTARRRSWGETITKERAMEMLKLGEKEGLMLMASNMKDPQVICSCCGCCCGIVSIIRSVPRPADFTAGNYVANFDKTKCNGCKKCVKRCNMKAMKLEKESKKPMAIDFKKCIGCGVCIPVCKEKAITLIEKENPSVPPQDHDELYDIIAKGKKTTIGKTIHLTKAMAGLKT